MRVEGETLDSFAAKENALDRIAGLTALLFAGRDHIQVLIDSSRMPTLATWVGAWAPEAMPLLDLGDDPRAEDIMPYLVQVSPEDSFLRFLLTPAQPPSLKALWTSGAVIFIRQDLPIPSLYNRLQRNVMAPDAQGRRHFLRFWDADVVGDLLGAIAEEGGGFRGPFPPGTQLLLPQPDGRVMKISLHQERDEPDGATLRITAKLRQLLANAVERKAVQRLIERIIAANADLPTDRQDLGALLGQAADALLTDGWPLHALAPVLRVTAREGLAPEDMPHAARAILNDAEKSHTARGRILEHEEAALFAAARTSGLGGGGDIWLLP